MASDIALSASMRQSLIAYQSLSSQIDAVQKRLSTGKRVSSALDNAPAFFTSSALSSRANNLNALSDNIAKAKGAIDAANNGIKTIQALLVSAQSLANSALQSTSTSVKITGSNSSALTTSSQIATNGGSGTRFKAGDTVTVSDGTTTATYTAVNNDTVQSFLNAINTSSVKATASLNSSGQLEIKATSGTNLTIGQSISGPSGGVSGVFSISTGTTSFTANSVRQSYATQFDSIRSQIDTAVADSAFNGVNLLSSGSQSVVLNESGSSSLTMSGASVTSSGLGLSASVDQFQTDADVNAALTNLTNAVNTLQAQTVAFTANTAILGARADFNKQMAATLQSGADSLTAADTNEDSAMLLALQSRQQLAGTVLSMSSNADKSALRLFGLG